MASKINRFRVKIGDETTAPIFDNEANAERFAAGCYHGLSYAFDIARENGSIYLKNVLHNQNKCLILHCKNKVKNN